MKRQKRESEKRCLCQWVPLLFNSQVATTQIYELTNQTTQKLIQINYCPRNKNLLPTISRWSYAAKYKVFLIALGISR